MNEQFQTRTLGSICCAHPKRFATQRRVQIGWGKQRRPASCDSFSTPRHNQLLLFQTLLAIRYSRSVNLSKHGISPFSDFSFMSPAHILRLYSFTPQKFCAFQIQRGTYAQTRYQRKLRRPDRSTGSTHDYLGSTDGFF